ncbi:hypothetical protein [Luteibacter sp.]|uniref:hypothetical protein n=1 Tax=Luteibacter sp. TaxID=1886636 RepID=UPI0028076BC6|nr:hypothetical protein [Luteibacter sp.]MDQ8049281.1 hypothetical protein [Luteibacter sp.]
MCDRAATSNEHVPPKCIFPAMKDADGKDYRRNLIKVPSCDEHNTDKSDDDQYLMMVLSAYFRNNAAASKQIETKISCAWERAPGLAEKIVKNPVSVEVSGKVSMAFEVDKRFDRSLAWAANALHYSISGKRASPAYQVLAYPLFQHGHEGADDVNRGRARILKLAEMMFEKVAIHGDNPDIFWYQLITGGREAHVRMCFFDAFVVVCGSSITLNS